MCLLICPLSLDQENKKLILEPASAKSDFFVLLISKDVNLLHVRKCSHALVTKTGQMLLSQYEFLISAPYPFFPPLLLYRHHSVGRLLASPYSEE